MGDLLRLRLLQERKKKRKVGLRREKQGLRERETEKGRKEAVCFVRKEERGRGS